MRSHDDTIPNLEDAVSGGFSEFKIGEKKFKESQQKKEETIEHSAVETNTVEKSEPKYGYKIDAVESRVDRPRTKKEKRQQNIKYRSQECFAEDKRLRIPR